MASPAQSAANRANAQQSTGPRSVEGKSVSRFNALKHGVDAESVIIPGENPADYDSLAAGYRHELNPRTPTEHFHVDTMIRAEWQKRRLQKLESDLFKKVLEESGTGNIVEALLSGTPAAKLLTRIQRQIASFERAWYRANKALHDQRRAAQAEDSEAFGAYLDSTSVFPNSPEMASFPPSTTLPGCPKPERFDNPALRL